MPNHESTKSRSTSATKPRSSVAELPTKQRQAPPSLIEKWAQAVCWQGDDSGSHTSAFLLLLDEIERSASDYLRVSSIIWSAQNAAFGLTEEANSARQEFVENLRAKHGLRIVEKKRATA